MRKTVPDLLERARVREGDFGSKPGRMTGAYLFQLQPPGAVLLAKPQPAQVLKIIANEADPGSEGWEHVSVSLAHRTPTWMEMAMVKELFWEDEEVVVQYHPARSQYVNYHPYTLHLFRHASIPFPVPPPVLVGPLTPGRKTGETPPLQRIKP